MIMNPLCIRVYESLRYNERMRIFKTEEVSKRVLAQVE